jgi:hypothetical protein
MENECERRLCMGKDVDLVGVRSLCCCPLTMESSWSSTCVVLTSSYSSPAPILSSSHASWASLRNCFFRAFSLCLKILPHP